MNKIIDRFWSKVNRRDDTSCWPWNGGIDKDGYGKFQYCPTGKNPQVHVRAHRFSYELTFGYPGKFVVIHSCDNPICCNPSHLRIGSQSENRKDCVSKGRQAKGNNHGKIKLSDEDILAIRSQWIRRVNTRALAQKYGVHTGVISSIGSGKYFRSKIG